ncbi:Putative phosphatidylserine decarboxylase [Elusimicrobium minutum Pei191]|uniref:Putative phosphatidylserine decarboxylase n=1 Tax=Elusimicrobium minutum (strain Pei191) TaxID=445932 RepID=B2KAY6_ELUMP|nr:phosphatidylserine decarboxylase [Elusimicrobium minutum]ACC97682.1 Putative phosphatidylserine decarboxylase [Elusimicrobium minutum Pei191]
MFEDFKNTVGQAFGWVFTVLPEARIPVLLIAIAGALLGWFLWCWLGIIVLAFAVFCAFFFRSPERNTVFSKDEIACPADGTVMSVKTEEDPNVVVIRIFLSIFNVHVQRATMSGTVEDVVYTQGGFLFANNPDADKNERNLIKLSKNYKFAHIEQITGAIARRIICNVKKGDELTIGQLVGHIRFGSQVAVYLPKDAVRVLVKEGQKVEGGVTVLGLWHQAP